METSHDFRFRGWCVLFLSVFIVLYFTGSSLAKEGLKFTLDPTWMFVKDETVGKTYIMTFVPLGQSMDNRESLFEIVETTRKSYPKKIEEAHEALIKERLESCPDTRDEVINEDGASMIFEMTTADCPSNQDQYQLTRIIYGKKMVYVMIFTHRATEPSSELKDSWLKVLRAAKIQ